MKIGIVGNYGAKNIGDELILSGLLNILKKIDPDADITVFSADPLTTSSEHKVQSVRSLPGGLRSSLRYIFLGGKNKAALLSCDFIILGGGGLFAGIKKLANLIWSLPALLTLYQDKKLIIYGQSLENMPGPLARRLIKYIFEKAILVTVRDTHSQEILQQMGVQRDAILLPDLAFAGDITDQPKPPKTLAVALRNSSVLQASARHAIADFLDWLISEKKWQINFLNFQRGATDDKDLHAQIAALMKNGKQCGHDENLPVSTYLLGMPLHSIIYATLTTTPFITLPYATKVSSFLHDAGLTNLALNMDRITFENLRQKFIFLEKNDAPISATLKNYRQKARQTHAEMAKKLAVILHQTLI